MAVTASVREHWQDLGSQIGDLKSDRVMALLEEQILSGALAPGTVLPTETELSEALGVSRTVLRDAVRALVARGLLTVRQGRGTIVREPSDEAYASAMVALLARSELSMGDVMSARATIETLLVGLAAEAAIEPDLTDLERAHEAMREAVARGDAAAAGSAHSAFHAVLLRAVHQPALSLMLTPMSQIAVLTGAASVRDGSMADWEVDAHGPILSALRARDAAAAQDAMAEHFAVSTRPAAYQDFLDRPFAQAYFERRTRTG